MFVGRKIWRKSFRVNSQKTLVNHKTFDRIFSSVNSQYFLHIRTNFVNLNKYVI